MIENDATVASVFVTFAIGSIVQRLHNAKFALGMNARPPLHDGCRESWCQIATKGCRPQLIKAVQTRCQVVSPKVGRMRS